MIEQIFAYILLICGGTLLLFATIHSFAPRKRCLYNIVSIIFFTIAFLLFKGVVNLSGMPLFQNYGFMI